MEEGTVQVNARHKAVSNLISIHGLMLLYKKNTETVRKRKKGKNDYTHRHTQTHTVKNPQTNKREDIFCTKRIWRLLCIVGKE